MSANSDDQRRAVPRTDAVLAHPDIAVATARLGRDLVKATVTRSLERCRTGDIAPEAVIADVLEHLPTAATSLRPVINATGVVVHTNLGRAPLSAAARDAVLLAAGTTDVELDLASGRRTRRGRGALDALLAAVPAAEDALIVNNGAAALSLLASTFARGREIVVARGEIVEIGDGFRIPDLLTASGATLREVGTTNRCHLDDYAEAITDATALVLKVHPSNFVIQGFTAGVPVSQLASLQAPVVVDIGSGLLAPHPRLPGEPDAQTTLAAGAALVTASGDKLLGGPQAGIVLGRQDPISRMRRHPLARAFRVDKLTLSALEATLRGPTPPVIEALERSGESMLRRANAIVDEVAALIPTAEAVASVAVVGGGGAPGVELPSVAVAVPAELALALRTGRPSVMGHVANERLLLDLLAVQPTEDHLLVDALRSAAKG